MFCRQSIDKGTKYLKSTLKYEGVIYTWKGHTHCDEIATKLSMYDYCSDGVTSEDFIEYINSEYQNISGGSDTPKFQERLLYVLKHHEVQLQ